MNIREILEDDELEIIDDNSIKRNHNIYTVFEKSPNRIVTCIKVLIIGPKDTPYQDGFFFFTIKPTCKYPIEPPIIKFRSTDNKVRFHPKIDNNGAVSLEIIDNWNPRFTFKKILFELKKLFVSNIIRLVPEYKNYPLEDTQKYDEFIKYNTIKYAVIKPLSKIPTGFEDFRKVISIYFDDEYENYLSYIASKQYETKDIDYKINFIDKVYKKHQICDYRILMDELVNLGNNSDSESETGSENEEDFNNQNEEDN